MKHTCTRCGAQVGSFDPPHLCSDLAKRLARQEAVITMVEQIILRRTARKDRLLAMEIVEALAGRDLGT
jgi:hypothetical protein